MPTLQEQMLKDLDTVFFSCNDFAELRMVEDKECKVVIDNESVSKERWMAEFENVYTGGIRFFIKECDLDYIPRYGDTMKFDQDRYLIQSVIENAGVLEIVLQSKRGR